MAKTPSKWYARYPGDYGRKTRHLSMMEHGAYALLLDHYYNTGAPLPANAVQLHRICMAFDEAEQAACMTVLHEFFVLRDDGWHNDRADDELLKRSEISEKRSKSAAKRYANAPAKGHANAPAIAHTTTTTTTVYDGGGSARAREDENPKIETPENPTFRERLLIAAGIDPMRIVSPGPGAAGGTLDMAQAQRWIDDLGFSEDDCVRYVAEIRQVMSSPPSLLRYFTKPMQRIAGELQAAKLEPEKVQPTKARKGPINYALTFAAPTKKTTEDET